MKKLLSLILALVLVSGLTLTSFADGPDVSPNIPRSPSKPATTTPAPEKELETGMEVPKNVVPNKSYTAVVGKTYKLPDAVKLNCDTFFTSDPKILTVNMETGGFKAVANGTAYIVVVNTTARRYIKVTVGTGVTAAGNKTTTTETTTTTATSGKGALAGYSVTVKDTKALATSSGGKDWPITTYYFYSSSGKVVGTMSGTDALKIQSANNPSDGSLWLASQFNLYRGLSGTVTSPTPQPTVVDLDAYATEVIRLTNIEREKNSLPALDVDSEAMNLARIRAEETSVSYSHTRPNTNEAKNVRGMAVAENIAVGIKTPREATTAWMNSTGHYSNIMDSNAHSIGVGVYQASNGNFYWVQIIVWGQE